MAKRFFIWKDKNCKGVNPEWIEISYPEFKKITDANKTASNEEKRWFYKVPGIYEDDDYLVMECTFDSYRKSQNDKDRRIYESKLRDDFNESYSIISFDFVYTDDSGEEYTLHDIVADESVNVEEQTTANSNIDSLYKAILKLNENDREFISFWLDQKRNDIPDYLIAENLKISYETFRWKFKCICKALKNFSKNF